MVAAALVSWARERLGSALYRQGRRGRSSWGDFAGEDGAGGGDRDGVGAWPGNGDGRRRRGEQGRVRGVRGSSTGHGGHRGEHRKGGGAWRALVAPGKSGFVKQGALGAGLARVRPSGRDRWPRRRTAPPWARCRKEQR